MSKLKKAIELSRSYHQGQKRHNGDDYFIHPYTVMNILKKYDFPEECQIAGVLHDITEDTIENNININKTFGERVGFIIYALSKNKKPKENQNYKKKYEEEKKRKEGKIASFKNYINYRFLIYVNRFYVSAIADPWILFIKIADQIHNISTLDSLRDEKKLRKIEEIEKFFLPIYKKAEIVITPMYIDKYYSMMGELIEKLKEARYKFFRETKILTQNNYQEILVGLKTNPKTHLTPPKIVLLVHGFGVDKDDYGMFPLLAQNLSDYNFTVYRFDFSGCGESEGEFLETSLTKMTKDLEKIIDYIEKLNGKNCEIHIFAQSLGSVLAFNLNDKRIKSYIFSSIHYDIFNIISKYFKEGFSENGISEKKRSSGEITQVKSFFWQDIKKNFNQVLQKCKNFTTPSLFLYGEQDKIIPFKQVERIFQEIKGKKELKIIKEADHNLVPKRKEMIKLTLKWLKEN